MSTVSGVVERLRARYTVEHVGRGRYLITHAAGDELDEPAVLELDDTLTDAYVAALARSSEGGDESAALGLVAIHVDEEVQSALATGGRLTAIGVRRSRLTRRPEWFSDRIEGPADEPQGSGPFEWRL